MGGDFTDLVPEFDSYTGASLHSPRMGLELADLDGQVWQVRVGDTGLGG